jgi:hypothetical protein
MGAAATNQPRSGGASVQNGLTAKNPATPVNSQNTETPWASTMTWFFSEMESLDGATRDRRDPRPLLRDVGRGEDARGAHGSGWSRFAGCTADIKTGDLPSGVRRTTTRSAYRPKLNPAGQSRTSGEQFHPWPDAPAAVPSDQPRGAGPGGNAFGGGGTPGVEATAASYFGALYFKPDLPSAPRRLCP